MGRKHPLCAIYMLTNKVNGKIYIGETTNYVDRMSYYKNSSHRTGEKRAIEQAITMYGWGNFESKVLLDHMEDPSLLDKSYRLSVESDYIRQYNSSDPKIGYNYTVSTDYTVKAVIKQINRHGTEQSANTRIKRSDQIFVYDIDHDDVYMYLGKKDFADKIGKDRSIIARCTKNGKKTSHYYIFFADKDLRRKYASEALARKICGNGTNGKAEASLPGYVKALKRVDEYAIRWGYEPIDVDEIISVINSNK